MTRRCLWCPVPHIIGPDMGPPFSDGLCWKAARVEDFKWYAPKVVHLLENAVVILALAYLAAQLVRWSLNNFSVVGL